MKKLEKKRALVVGAASGIGAEIVRLYAAEGASVVINYRSRSEAAEILRKELTEKYGTIIHTCRADMSSEEEVKKMVDFTVKELGGIDILVVSSAVNFQTPVKDMSLEQWEKVIKVNLTGLFLCNRYVLPHMLEKKSGRIINITSQLGQIGAVNDAHYAASKAGIIGFTKSLAREVGKEGVLVNAIGCSHDKWPNLLVNFDR